MFNDETKRMQAPSGSDRHSAAELLRIITQRVNESLGVLNGWRDELRKLGMNLPSSAADSLTTLTNRLEALNRYQSTTQMELRQLRALASTTALINSTLDPQDVLNQVMDKVIQMTGAERGYIMLRDVNTGEFTFAVARGIDREQVEKTDMKVSNTILRSVAETGEPVLTDNAATDDRYAGQQSIIGLQLRSILAVPLKVRDDVIGVVYCDNRFISGIFQKHELETAAAFANQAGVAIENARLFESARSTLNEISETRDLMNNIFTSIASGVITVDRENVITICNPAAQAITGLTLDQALGRPIVQALPVLDHKFLDVLEQVHNSLQQQLVSVTPEVAPGDQRYWNANISPLRGNDGVPQGLAIVLDDLTEIRRREAQLATAGLYLSRDLLKNLKNIDMLTGGEEREITAIFADVRGFTSFSERLQPEELMEIINKYLSLASDAIDFYGGMVDKYMGDAVTGFFNTQLNPMDNHAAMCVRAAMNMIFDLFALHEKLPEDHRLFYGVGIHTGLAVLGNVGGESRKEFAALGDAADISKVLQENAGPGEIIISQATFAQVHDFFECEQFVPAKTKGREDITVAYKVRKRKRNTTVTSRLVDPGLSDLLKDD